MNDGFDVSGKGEKTSPSHHPPPLTKSGLTAKTPMIPSAM